MTMTAGENSHQKLGGRAFLIPGMAALVVLMALVVMAPAMTEGGPPSGNIIRQSIYTVLLLATMWISGVFKKPSKLLVVPIGMLIAIAWCWISLSWSIVPMISARRVLLTTMIIWTVFLLVDDCGYDRTVRTLMLSLAVLLVVNFAAVFISPSTAIHQVAEQQDRNLVGDWRGILPQKNYTGEFCAFTIILFFFYQRRTKTTNNPPKKKGISEYLSIENAIRSSIILASAIFLYKSGSKTSAGMVALGLTSGLVYLSLSPRARMYAIPVAVLASMIGMLYWAGTWKEAIGPFAKPTAFTGRVQIWPHLVSYIQDHPLTGTGYGAFWNIGDSSPIYAYSKNWVSTISSGHNGYLDLASQIGLPGLIVAVLAAFVIPLYKLLTSQSLPRWRGALLVSMIVFCAGHNMTESGLFDRDVIVWVFLLITIALTEIATRKRSSSSSSSRSRRKRSLPSFG